MKIAGVLAVLLLLAATASSYKRKPEEKAIDLEVDTEPTMLRDLRSRYGGACGCDRYEDDHDSCDAIDDDSGVITRNTRGKRVVPRTFFCQPGDEDLMAWFVKTDEPDCRYDKAKCRKTDAATDSLRCEFEVAGKDKCPTVANPIFGVHMLCC
jgi:hypothetical protein